MSVTKWDVWKYRRMSKEVWQELPPRSAPCSHCERLNGEKWKPAFPFPVILPPCSKMATRSSVLRKMKKVWSVSLLGIWRTYHKEAWKMVEIQGHQRNVCQFPNPTTIQATASKEGSRVSPLQKLMGSIHTNRQWETPSSAHPTVLAPMTNTGMERMPVITETEFPAFIMRSRIRPD